MKTGIIIQARMSSTRLPGKVLLELPGGSNETVLGRCAARLKRCRMADELLVATTVCPEDDAVAAEASRLGLPVFRGSLDDVLSRYHGAAVARDYDHIVRVTSDCPCIDPEVVDRVIMTHLEQGSDYASNIFPRTFPHGLDTEIMTMKTLERAHREAGTRDEREHVTYYINTTHAIGFRSASVIATPEETGPDIRITLDTADDFTLLWAVFDLLGPGGLFAAADIVRLFRERPWLCRINSGTRQKDVFESESAEVAEALEVLRLQGLDRAAGILKTAINAERFSSSGHFATFVPADPARDRG